jgi:hypothetical protein
MNAVKATIQNRRINLPAPEELPDGTEVLIDITPLSTEKIGIDESQWRDDPESLADWDSWINKIEPIELTSEEVDANARFVEKFKQFNIEAVRKQMNEGSSG